MFCVTATGTGLTYQWQTSPVCGGPWSFIPGATTSCLTVTGVSTASYRCMVTGTACGNTVTTNCATLTVINPVAITSQPSNAQLCSGSNTNFSVTATGTGLIYQWQVNTGSGFGNVANGAVPGITGAAYAGATTATLTITGATTGNERQFHAILDFRNLLFGKGNGAGMLKSVAYSRHMI